MLMSLLRDTHTHVCCPECRWDDSSTIWLRNWIEVTADGYGSVLSFSGKLGTNSLTTEGRKTHGWDQKQERRFWVTATNGVYFDFSPLSTRWIWRPMCLIPHGCYPRMSLKDAEYRIQIHYMNTSCTNLNGWAIQNAKERRADVKELHYQLVDLLNKFNPNYDIII